jgi:hypothetical protein
LIPYRSWLFSKSSSTEFFFYDFQAATHEIAINGLVAGSDFCLVFSLDEEQPYPGT